MALTKVTSGLISADASSVDLNIDAGTLYIDATNNRVGVGTTSPTQKLDVDSGHIAVDAGYGLVWSGDADRIITPEDNSVGGLFKVGASAATRFMRGSNESMRIDSSGNVGIGTSSPAQTVEVSASGTSAIQITSTGGTAQLMLNPSGTNPAYINYNRSSASVLAFYDHNASAERMRIDSSGNVGIGTSSASGILHLYKSTGTTDLRIQSNQYSANYGFVGGATGANALGIYDYGASAYRFVLNSSGNVGIGTSSPVSKLQVQDSIGMQSSSTVSVSSGVADSGLNLYTLHGTATGGAGRLRVVGTENNLNKSYAEYFYVYSKAVGGNYYVNLKFIDEAVVNNDYGRPRLYLYNSSTYNSSSSGRQNTNQSDNGSTTSILQIGITNVANAAGAFELVAEPLIYRAP